MRRVIVVGMSGAGKTTAARQLSELLQVPFHEMDELAIGPGWTTPPSFSEDLVSVVSAPAWVIDSWGPAGARSVLWPAADGIVWLDYPRRVVLPWLLRRSLVRSWRRAAVFGGNVERWRGWLLPGHPVWHAVTTFGARRRTLAQLAAAHPQAQLVRLRRPRELQALLAGLGGGAPHEVWRYSPET